MALFEALLTFYFHEYSGDAGKLVVDSHITGKIAQLKEQIATLEKREERYVVDKDLNSIL